MEISAETDAATPSVGESDFGKAYSEGIWATMFLNFCNPASSDEASEQMARWWSLTAEAHKQGFSAEIQAAQNDHARRIAVMRIVTTCPEGLEDRLGRTKIALDALDRCLRLARRAD